MTCQHFLFQRFGIMFFTPSILLIPELLASIGVESVQENAKEEPEAAKFSGKEQKKKMLQQRREIRSKQTMHKYVYYYSLAALLFVGYIYKIWILMQNRINLIPYITFFQTK
jgi:hypothetical protein